jgi:endonuclease I
MKKFKNILLTMAGLMLAINVFAQIPTGYYDDAEGLIETPLQQALHDIIDGHTSLSYDNLWTAFYDTDRKSNGKVWDMYSDNPNGDEPYEYTFYDDQCGNYSGEGICYNREHSWPKSWFNDILPMNTDMFHLVPTDGYTNGKRDNYPFGEVDNVLDWTSENGSKLGTTNASWTSGKVFEPIDEYKGDFARNYFYMSVRYYNEDGSWNSNDMVDGSQLKSGPLAMMMQWSIDDTVSQKEIDRNNAIYLKQHNRNPFIDHPEYVNSIWGDPQSIIAAQKLEDVVVSPNPTKDIVNINIPKPAVSGYTVNIYNYCGKKIQSEYTDSQKISIDLSSLQSGIYILRLNDNVTQEIVTRKIVKQ